MLLIENSVLFLSIEVSVRIIMSIVIRSKKGILTLDIHYGGAKRTRPSTGLKDSEENREFLESKVIPKILFEISQGTYLPKAKSVAVVQTVGEYSKTYFIRHQHDRRDHVNKALQQNFKKHILPDFGDKQIDSITAMQLFDWQNKKLGILAASSVKKYRSILNMMLNDIVIEEIIPKNPFEKVKYPVSIKKYNGDDEDNENSNVDPFSLEEISELIKKTHGYMVNFIGIMAFSGIRPGELIALKWSDVKMDDEYFEIKRAIVRGKFGYTKTVSSKRQVAMIPGVKEYFLEQAKLTKGDRQNESNMVFLNSSKDIFYSHDIIAKQFKALLDKNDNRYLYQLRHSFASLMISNGEDIMAVSKMMGHKSLDITMKTYAKAYKFIRDKTQRKQMGSFMKDWHQSGTIQCA